GWTRSFSRKGTASLPTSFFPGGSKRGCGGGSTQPEAVALARQGGFGARFLTHLLTLWPFLVTVTSFLPFGHFFAPLAFFEAAAEGPAAAPAGIRASAARSE